MKYQTAPCAHMMPKKAISTRFRFFQLPNASRSGALATSPSSSQLGELRALGELGAHPHRDCEQHGRDEERDAPAPGGERILADRGAGGDDHQQRGEQAERGRRLDPAGRRAALVVGRMLGDIDRRAAIFAAERDALEDAQEDRAASGRATRPGRRSAGSR